MAWVGIFLQESSPDLCLLLKVCLKMKNRKEKIVESRKIKISSQK